MAKAKRTRPKKKEPPARMLDLIVGYWVSKMVHVAVKLELADLLRDGPRSPDDLARAAHVDAHSLARLLRALASVGVFTERRDGRFALTPLAKTLCSDSPASMRAFALMMVEDYNWQPWGRLLDGVRTGGLPFNDVHGMGAFEYLGAHPEDARVFGEAMASISGTENPAVATAYDFSKIRTLVDVGGSHGHLLSAILERHKGLRGVVFDRPEVIEQAKGAPYVKRKAVAGRIELVPGDFFRSVPAGADAYLMKYILHDWDDGRCVTILRNCRDAMEPRGKVLVVDNVIPAGNDPHWGKLLDINMLVLTGGRERTREQFRDLFAKARLRLTRVVSTACPLSIIEGTRA